ncbi:MAG: CheR family methyltransferase [bacterium]
MIPDLENKTSDVIELNDKEFKLIRDLVYSKFGINLTEQKKALIVGRLQKVLREHGFSSFFEYYEHVTRDRSGEALVTLVNRISTNHTFFYREHDHFEYLTDTVLPELKKQMSSKGKMLRVWCAACSSGEESYMLSMLIHEFFKHEISNWDIAILATDISERVLEIAKAGVYSDENISRMPDHLKRSYFKATGSGKWAVTENVRKLVLYRRFNLMRPQFPFKRKFHFVFCRNVMIYFDEPTKKALVKRIYEFLDPGGYLFIGHSETLGKGDSRLRYIRPAVYRKEA